ncbi:peptidoglycan editing factor PgeF [Sphaerotilus mobilis]|nr:peptidoglycan editing factor PgeF [Sphaerotilus mobilis]
MSSRAGGVSAAPFDGLNLKVEVGDDPAAVTLNRARLQGWIGARPVRLNQVHGVLVQALEELEGLEEFDAPDDDRPVPVADASVCGRPGLACEVQVADCLPVLFADRDGRAVAAAHAGWRGLAGGVLDATLAALHARHGVAPDRVEAWLGPCIGPAAFEVGADVLAAFGGSVDEPGACFRPRLGHPGKWWADLPQLARLRLAQAGVSAVGGNDGGTGWCTVTDASRFFSYRRDRTTGRMAGLVWLRERA